MSGDNGPKTIARRESAVVMNPERLGAARLHRYSFNRMMIRRAVAAGWSITIAREALDDEGRGEVAFRVEAEGHVFHFVAFTITLDESEHTDRVISERWEITAALIEGELDPDTLDRLRASVPHQEDARLDPTVLVLTRGNRSVRFFEAIADRLAVGLQPDPEAVADAGYLMRSTAFYGNGKFGMRSFGGYATGHPLSAPYRAQMLAAWCFRELSYVSVERVARARGGTAAVRLEGPWRRFFGLGNATGLGLVPYAMNHPAVIDGWLRVREDALARVRGLEPTNDRLDEIDAWLDRSLRHFRSGSDDDCGPFRSPQEMTEVAHAARAAWIDRRAEARPFDAWCAWAEQQDAETAEFVVSTLLELDEMPDADVDAALLVDESSRISPLTTAADLRSCLDDRYGWLAELPLDGDDADAFLWVLSDNTEEPRRTPRRGDVDERRALTIDVALRLWSLRRDLAGLAGETTVSEICAQLPEHRFAIDRLGFAHLDYGEPRDNVCSPTHLPLQLQRFQLATYGMDDFKPKSTDWLRVTLFQGAPRVGDLGGPDMDDRWVLPERPRTPVVS